MARSSILAISGKLRFAGELGQCSITSISDAHTDTRMPANLDDEELEGDFDPAGHPMSQPTVYTYVIVR